MSFSSLQYKLRRKVANNLYLLSDFLKDPKGYLKKKEDISRGIDADLLDKLRSLTKTIEFETIIDIGANIGNFTKTVRKYSLKQSIIVLNQIQRLLKLLKMSQVLNCIILH